MTLNMSTTSSGTDRECQLTGELVRCFTLISLAKAPGKSGLHNDLVFYSWEIFQGNAFQC